MNSRDIFQTMDFERQKRGYTVREFSTRCGITPRTWTAYKTNPDRIPLGVIERAANILIIPMVELIKRREI